jgi:hypothetical protein
LSIEDYFQQIRELIEASKIVFYFNFNAEKKGLYKGFIRGDIYFNDGSLLHLREFVNVETSRERGKYAYQYMDATKTLVFRYDNAEHHQRLNLSNFPHHKHEESEDNIVSFSAPTLADILQEIEELL